MKALLHDFLLACVVILATSVITWAPSHATDVVELRWWQLASAPPGRDVVHELLAKISTHGQISKRIDACLAPQSDLVTAFSGERVKISGFIVPLDGDEEADRTFLLIPFAGGCDKFPPPRNQMILVTPTRDLALDKYYDPVDVIGVIRTAPAETKVGSAGYRLAAETVEPQK